MSYGHVLKTVGRQADSIAAYRRAIARRAGPRRGLVEPRQSEDGRVRRRRHRGDGGGARRRRTSSDEDRFHLHFALGKALEDRGEAEAVVRPLCRGQPAAPRRRSTMIPTRSATMSAAASPCSRPISSPRREGQGCPAPDPIFILGMPRAGSTLIEQILASHPLVEGTMELPDIPALAKRLERAQARDRTPRAYPECLAGLDADALAALGAEYLERTRVQRKTDRPFFIDKMPNNWAACRADPADPAQRQDRRRAPPSARLLLLQLQAAFRARPGLQLRSRRARPLLSRLCRR